MRLASIAMWLTVAASLTLGSAAVAQVTLSNIVPRRSADGAIMDAHDGNVITQVLPNGTILYLWYAAGYGECSEKLGKDGCLGGYVGCGFLNNHSVNLYTSIDLATWTPHGNVLPLANRPANWSTLFSPKVIYNQRTQLFVLWVNYLAYSVRNYSYAVFVSPNAAGPFVLVDDMAGISTQAGYPSNTDVGDFSFLVDEADPNRTAYILYSAHAQCRIERLTPDYLASDYRTSKATTGILPHGNEAPAFFQRGGYYYALVSDSCCYCGQGGHVRAFRASRPLGPYEYLGEIAQGPNRAAWGGDVCTSSQQTATINVNGRTDGNATVIWLGDRWQSAPDGLKGHDFTFWEPLTFMPDGNVSHMAWVDNFTLDLAQENMGESESHVKAVLV